MRINKPLTLQELKQGDLIPKGTYTFEVINAEDTVSKTSGVEMIKLTLKIFLDDGRERMIFDYLIESMQFKLGHFAEATGLMDEYNSNTLRDKDCIGKTGLLKIVIQKDKTGAYPDKNSVSDYIAKSEGSLHKPLGVETKEFINDDLPF